MPKVISTAAEIPANGKVVIDFFATWCGPCRRIAPAFEEMEKEFQDVTFLKVDVDLAPGLSAEYDIGSIPTFVIFKDGKAVKKIEGAAIAAVAVALEDLA